VAHNEFGTPLVNSLFETAKHVVTSDLLCYINADIILLSDFMKAVRQVASQKRRFLMVGQRWDIDITETLGFAPNWEEHLRTRVTQNGRLHPPTGIDYFLFPRGFWGRIPHFAIGRTAWDNWLLYRARAQGASLIDATQTIMVVHQNHDYAHIPDGVEGAWKGQEAKRNQKLIGGYEKSFTLLDANWLLTSQGLMPAATPEHQRRARETWLLLHYPALFVFRKWSQRLSLLPRRLLTSLVLKVPRLFKLIYRRKEG
jgi:hypothetical protein